MARAQQARELFARFRMRLGEPTPGTFGSVDYTGLVQQLDEIMDIFNQAQDHVTWICYSANLSLIEKRLQLLVEPDITNYILPEDFIGEVSVCLLYTSPSPRDS